jgi:cytochrome P450
MEYNPFDTVTQDDPYPTYKWLRDEAPVYHNEQLDIWAISRFDDVYAATVDPETFSNDLKFGFAGGETRAPSQFLFTDGLTHSRERAMVSKWFTPRRIAAWEPRVREVARQLLDPLAAQGSCDIIQDFAALFPMALISELMGIPESDRDMVRHWTDDYLARDPGIAQPPERALAADAALCDYFREAREDRQRRPREDLLTILANTEVEDEDGRVGPLSDSHFVGNCQLLVIAGNETTTKLIANSVLQLHRHPDQRADLIAHPDVIANAVEETMRYDAPSQWQNRRVAKDVTLHGVTIPENAFCGLVTGAACRDERRYPDPDRYDVRRDVGMHLALGWGQHLCLGKSLARLEGQIALEEILARFPGYEVDESKLKRVYVTNVAGYCEMPISYEGRRAA